MRRWPSYDVGAAEPVKCDNSIIIGDGFFNILDELSHRVYFTFHNASRRRRKDSPFSGGIAARSGHRRQRVECIYARTPWIVPS
jgi:hypothetical protein